MKKRHIHLVWMLIATLLTLAGIYTGYKLSFRQPAGMSLKDIRQTNKVDELLQFIREHYVDQIDVDSLVDRMINDIMAQLDPHSVYIPKKESASVRETMQGNFVGLGVEFQMDADTFTVLRVIPHSPAQKAGIRPFDQILCIDRDTVAGKNVPLDSIVNRLKGPLDSRIELCVRRPARDSVFRVRVRRDKVPLTSVPAAFMINDTLGYIRLEIFSETTHDEFLRALEQLKKQGLRALVLDLRGNSGGYLKQAGLLADEFLPAGNLIFYTKNHDKLIRKVYATGRGEFEEGPLYVLIDENTASAAEIVAGALQDNDRATIIGRRSFGKGLVQEEIQLKDGSMMRITTARYYTPSGRCIQRPYRKGHQLEYENDFYKRYASGELFSRDSIKVNDSLQFRTKKGRIVYGGGGIVPDIFVPLDRNYLNQSYELIYLRHTLNKILRDYVRRHYDDLLNLTRDQYVHSDTIPGSLFRFMLQRTGRDTTDYPPERVRRFENFLHAVLGRNLYGTDVYQQIRLQTDPMIRRILHPADTTAETPVQDSIPHAS